MRKRFTKVVIKKPYVGNYVSIEAFFVSKQFNQPQVCTLAGQPAKSRYGWRIFLPLILAVLFALPFYGQAQEDPEEILKAITKIRTTIPDDARTASSLGTKREGNGVVIDSNGHILTIGYLIKPILADLIHMGRSSKPPRPWLGVYAEEGHGRVFVNRVASHGPAEKAGLKAGDIVLGVNDQDVKGLADFYRKVWGMGASGVDVPLKILHETQIKDVTIRSEDHFSYLVPIHK